MDEPKFDVYVDQSTATTIVQLSLKLGIPVDELLSKIFEAGLADQIQKN